MKFIEVIKISTRALLRQKMRTFLTGLAVFIGVFLVVFMVSATTGGEKILLEQFTGNFDLKNIQVASKGRLQFNFGSGELEEDGEVKPVTDKTVRDIENIKGVVKAQPIVTITGKTVSLEGHERKIKGAFGAGFDLDSKDKYIKDIVAGKVRDLEANEVLLNKQVAVSYDIKPKQLVGTSIIVEDDPSSFFSNKQKSRSKTYTYKIVGVVDIGSQQISFITSVDQSIEMLSASGGFSNKQEYIDEIGYDQVYVSAKDEEIVDEVAKAIKKLGYDAMTVEQVLEIFGTVTNVIKIMFSMFGIVALVVASVGIVNTMIMSVYERTKEIGVMKAIGASRADIRNLFLTEAAIIGFLSGLFAMLVSLGFMAIVEAVLVGQVFPAQGLDIKEVFITPIWLVIVPVFFSTIIGMLAGVYPAIRASRLDPVEALRCE